MKYPIKKIEKTVNIKLKRNAVSLGLDTASKSGYCIAKTNTKTIKLDIGFINIDVKGIKDRVLKNALRYEELYRQLKKLIKSNYIVVIEDVFHSFNAYTTILLARIGAIAWTLAKEIDCKKIMWKTAVQARKGLSLPCNKKKKIVMNEMNKILNTKIKNSDMVDALILAINGLIKEK